MPALAIIVMSFRTMPFSLSQYASVPATSRNGSPDEKPNRNIVHAAGCVNAFQTEGLAGLDSAAAAAAIGASGTVVDNVRRVIGKPRRRVDRAAFEACPQAGRHELVVDAPADIVRARRAAIAPPGVVLALRMQGAIAVDPTSFVRAKTIQPLTFRRQAAGVLLVRGPIANVERAAHDVPVAAQHVVASAGKPAV